MKPKHRVMCLDCGKLKILFDSESKANNFIKFNAEEIPHGHLLRSYYCISCCGWHVSSHEHHGISKSEIAIYQYRKYMRQLNKRAPISEETLSLMHNIAESLRDKNLTTRNEVKRYLTKVKKTGVWNEKLYGHWCKLLYVCYEDLGISE